MEKKKQHKIKLEEQKKELLFSVPENYFEELPQRIQKRVIQDQEVAWYKGLMVNPVFRYASAFSAVLLLAVSIYFFQTADTVPSYLVANVTDEEIYYYLEDNYTFSDPEVVQSVEQELLLSEAPLQLFDNEETLDLDDPEELEVLMDEF